MAKSDIVTFSMEASLTVQVARDEWRQMVQDVGTEEALRQIQSDVEGVEISEAGYVRCWVASADEPSEV